MMSDASVNINMISKLLILLLLSSKYLLCFSAGEFTCDVSVSIPGEAFTYVPQGSAIYFDCVGESDQSPAWSVRLTETAENLHQFSNPSSKTILNGRGYYEIILPSNGSDQNVVQLLVNSTSDENNKTFVNCADVASLEIPILFETTLVIYEPSPKVVTSRDVSERSIQISWNPLSSLEANHSQAHYFLTVKSHNTFNESFQLNQPYYNYTALEHAPPCDVYNFSVTATYVGATYTGAGCSVPSPVLSRMLPSLPVISELEASIGYSLMKLSDGSVRVTVKFLPAVICEDYPADNYTFFVSSSRLDSVLQETVTVPQAADKAMIEISKFLNENNVFTVKIFAANRFGTATTKEMAIYTTDVQQVTAKVVSRDFANGDAVVTVQCDFITNSDAQGCMVVLVGEFNNITANITRDTTSACSVIENVLNETFHKVFGFDIESGGSVSSVAVPGVVLKNNSAVLMCSTSTASSSSVLVVALATSTTFLVLILLLSVLIVTISLLLRSKVKMVRSSNTGSTDNILESTDRETAQEETKVHDNTTIEPNQDHNEV